MGCFGDGPDPLQDQGNRMRDKTHSFALWRLVPACLLLPLFLTGCFGPPRAEEVKTYLLDANFPPAAVRRGVVLLVAPPRASPGYDTAAMVYGRGPQELNHFARHRWADAPARMLAPLIVQALEGSGGFAAVVTPPTAARAGLRLDTEVMRLRQDFSRLPSRVEFVLRAQLTDLASGGVVASRTFSATVESERDTPEAGALAANRAVKTVLDELAAWAAQSISP